MTKLFLSIVRHKKGFKNTNKTVYHHHCHLSMGQLSLIIFNMTDKNQHLAELKAKAGEAPFDLLNCTTCATVAQRCMLDSQFTWCARLVCGSCDTAWWVCRRCKNQRVAFRTRSLLKRHHRQKHSEDSQSAPALPASPPPARWPSLVKNRKDPNASSDQPQTRLVLPVSLFRREASHNFFTHSLTDDANGMNGGLSMLVSNAVFKNGSMASKLNGDDISMIMSMSTFVDTLTRAQREQLAVVLQKTTASTERKALPSAQQLVQNVHGKASPPSKKRKKFPAVQDSEEISISVPTSKELLRSIFVEGKHALKENIPHPEICDDVDLHAYILPSECIADCMAHGALEGLHSKKEVQYQLLPNSKTAARLAQADQSARPIFLSLWCDDFEPNYSIKAGRGSVWLLTLTIESRESGTPTVRHVYPVACGPKGSDHNKVIQIIMEDIKGLRQGTKVLNGHRRELEVVKCYLLSWAMDQPENRGCNGLLLGGSTSFARFRHAVDISQLQEQIRPCRLCFQGLLKPKGNEFWTDRQQCNLCNNWMAHGDMQYLPPDSYPEEKLEEGRKLKPTVVTYPLLMEVCAETEQKVIRKEWSPAQATAYLKAYGLNQESVTGLLLCASNISALSEARRMVESAPSPDATAMLTTLEEEATEDPELYQPWSRPTIWNSGIEIKQCHQAGMHLLFLGVVKTMVFTVQEWAARRKKYTTLRESMKELSSELEGLKLSWLKIQPYQGKKLGSWVSENFMGFARVLPWMYGRIDDLPEDEKYELPNKPRSLWTGAENRDWLRSRNLPTTGKVKELKDRVTKHWGTPEAAGMGGHLSTVKKVMLSEWVMISYLMAMEGSSPNEVNVASRLIRTFLTFLHDHDSETQRKKPTWLSHYNFLCLLNLPEEIDNLGPLRNRWEGGVRGEGFLRVVKPMVAGTSRLNWQRCLLANLVQHKSMMLLSDSNKSVDESSPNDRGKIDLTSVKLYSCAAEAMAKMAEHEPVSIIVAAKEEEEERPRMYALYRDGAGRGLLELKPVEGSTPITRFGQHYHDIRCVTDTTAKTPNDISVAFYAALLPDRYGLREDSNLYTVFTDDWRVLDNRLNFVLPHMYLDMSLNNWYE